MPEICIIPPAGEPVHLDEAKNDRRVDFDADNSKVRGLIASARQAAESKTKLQLLHARWKLILDTFPTGSCNNFQQFPSTTNIPAYAIRLPHAPLVDVVSIQYVDMAGVLQTMPQTDYVVNAAMRPGIITPCFGKIWPIPLPQIGSVMVTYDAGFASPFITAGTLAPNQFKVIGPVTWKVGDTINFYNSGGALPAPLDASLPYTIASAGNGIYTLTDVFGIPVTFTSQGTGRNFIGVVPEGIISWMMLRIGSLYESREEVAILNKGKLEVLPYVDRMLDPYITDLYL